MKILPGILSCPPRTVAGPGSVGQLLCEARAFGASGVLVHGRSLERSGVLDYIMEGKDSSSVSRWCHPGGEPDILQVDELGAFIRDGNFDWVAAVGGGSVIDLAKASAGLCRAPLSAGDYQRGADIPVAEIPFLAVPTTAGTGSEATTVSVLTDAVRGLKKSIRHPSHMPGTVILDGDLLRGCPPGIIAASGLDALTQGIESYISRGSTWITDQLALKAFGLVSSNLEEVFSRFSIESAQALLEGSYLAGMALANAGLGLVHGLAHPLGIRFSMPHGLACALCLPHVLRFNRGVIGAKYDHLCGIAGGDLQTYIIRLLALFKLPNPMAGAEIEEIDRVVAETLSSGSSRANPRSVSEADVISILSDLQAG